MSVEVTTRHMEASDPVRSYAKRKGEELRDAFPGIEHVHIILDAEKRNFFAEVVVQAKNHIRVEAEEHSSTIRSALDIAVDKAEKQLRKHRDKIQDHKHAMKKVESSRFREDDGEE